jgi:hypothetical protein
VGREHTGFVAELTEALQAAELKAGELAGILASEKVAPARGPHKQDPAGEDNLLLVVDEDQVAGVLRRVSWRVEGANLQASDTIELLVVKRRLECETCS